MDMKGTQRNTTVPQHIHLEATAYRLLESVALLISLAVAGQPCHD